MNEREKILIDMISELKSENKSFAIQTLSITNWYNKLQDSLKQGHICSTCKLNAVTNDAGDGIDLFPYKTRADCPHYPDEYELIYCFNWEELKHK